MLFTRDDKVPPDMTDPTIDKPNLPKGSATSLDPSSRRNLLPGSSTTSLEAPSDEPLTRRYANPNVTKLYREALENSERSATERTVSSYV